MVPGAVIWSKTVGAGATSDRILPDGCLDIIWAAGALLVAGPDTRAHLAESAPGATYLGLRFAPGTGPAVLGVPASEVRDVRVELEALWRPSAVLRLGARLAEAADPARVLETAALSAMGAPDPGPAVVEGAIVASLRAGRPVRLVADRLGLSERQLHRRCLALFGYGPKTLGRVLRFDRAVALARHGVAFAEVAATTGYADQAHLSREVRALAGVPLGTLLRS
nr:helix-turn-helix domain-containing protein [Rugosimonospora africana]